MDEAQHTTTYLAGEIDRLKTALFECITLSGADTDGAREWRYAGCDVAKWAVSEAKRSRDDYDESLDESTALESELEGLQDLRDCAIRFTVAYRETESWEQEADELEAAVEKVLPSVADVTGILAGDAEGGRMTPLEIAKEVLKLKDDELEHICITEEWAHSIAAEVVRLTEALAVLDKGSRC